MQPLMMCNSRHSRHADVRTAVCMPGIHRSMFIHTGSHAHPPTPPARARAVGRRVQRACSPLRARGSHADAPPSSPPRPAPPPWAASTPPAPLPREASRAGGARPSTRVRPWPSMAHAHRAEPPARAAGHATLIAAARLAPPPCLVTSLVATTAVPLQPRARCSEHPRRTPRWPPTLARRRAPSHRSQAGVRPRSSPHASPLGCQRAAARDARRRPPPPAGQGRVRPTPSADCQGEPRLLGRRGGGHVRPSSVEAAVRCT